MFSRRHWLTTTFFASTGTLWRSVRAGEDDFSHACLLSDAMLGFVHSQRSPDVLIDTVFSTLDRFVIQPADLADSPIRSGCPEFLIFVDGKSHSVPCSICAAGNQATHFIARELDLDRRGLERSFQTPVLPTLSATMDFCADLLGILPAPACRLRQRVANCPQEVDPDVMRVATGMRTAERAGPHNISFLSRVIPFPKTGMAIGLQRKISFLMAQVKS